MAGALIVEDGLNEALSVTCDRVLLLQQMHGTYDKTQKVWSPDPSQIYDKLSNPDSTSAATATGSAASSTRTWRAEQAARRSAQRRAATQETDCAPGTTPPQPCQSAADNEWSLVNGISVPTYTLEGGSLERWRFIHAGVDEVFHVAVVNAENQKQPLYEIAVDGINARKVLPQTG